MKIKILLLIVLLIPVRTTDVYVFHSKTCGVCIDMLDFLNGISAKYPNVVIHAYDISEEESIALYDRFIEAYNLDVREHPVPAVFIGKDCFRGYSVTTRQLIEKKLEGCVTSGCFIGVSQDTPTIVIIDSTPTPSASGVLLLLFLVVGGIFCCLNPLSSEAVSKTGAKSFFLGYFVTSFLLCLALYNVIFVLNGFIPTQIVVLAVAVLSSVLSFLSVKTGVPHSVENVVNQLMRDRSKSSLFSAGIGACLFSLIYNAGIYCAAMHTLSSVSLSLVERLSYTALFAGVLLMVLTALYTAQTKSRAFAVTAAIGNLAVVLLSWWV